MSDHSERMGDAIRQALASRAGSLGSIASAYYSSLTASGYLRTCPFCNDKGQKFCIKRATGGHWYWGCHAPGCPVHFDTLKANGTGDTIGFLMVHDNSTRDAAVDKLLSMTGTYNPRNDLPPHGKTPKRKKAPAPPARTNSEAAPPPDPVEPPSPHVNPERGSDDHARTLGSPDASDPRYLDYLALTGSPTDERSDADDDETDFDEGPPLFPLPEPSFPPDPADNILEFSLRDGVPPPPTEPPEKTVWDDIWSRLSLNSGDRAELKKKRGFNSDTITKLGFRSNTRDNRALLQPVIAEWKEELLLSEGICVKDGKTGELKLNAQLAGYGLKKRAASRDQEDEWGWTEPILIPYFDSRGRVIGIRPHKGGLSGKRYMQEQGFELGFRRTRTRVKPYFNPLIWDQPDGWTGRCVLTEGEFKAAALFQCGIPAAAVPGIQMPRNDIFLDALADELKLAGIKEVIVCFDSEDKSHKPDPWTRHDTKVYQLFACHALRLKGLLTHQVTLPVEWQIDKKADWDGALAQFGSTAADKFHELLKTAKRYYEQFEMFGMDEEQRIIHCKFNRLTANPKILTGGEDEEELARFILKTPMPWRMALQVRTMAQELFETRGCYYIRKTKAIKDLRQEFKFLAEIKNLIKAADPGDHKTMEELEAALAAVELAIAGRPEILSDFTIDCEYLMRTANGQVQQLMRFTNKYGEKSALLSVPSEAIATSSRFREFCRAAGNFNLIMGDKPLQQLQIDIGKLTAWREIRELEMIGQDRASGLWIFGDCAYTQDGGVIFADDHDVIWHDGIGYRIAPEDLREFAHRVAPQFFQKLGMEPAEVLAEIQANPDREDEEVATIFFQLAVDMVCTFGDASGILVLGCTLAYAIAPEMLKKYHGHPGLWIHGLLQAGKTETAAFLMQVWGYSADYRTASLSAGTTNVGIDRWLSQYSNILMHLDEFRQKEADQSRIASLRMPFNRQAKGKGRLDQSNKTRSVEPATSPMVTGEGVTGDSATLSRYVEAILAVDRRIGTKKEQIKRFDRMKRQSTGYHRIIRWILMRRKWFATEAMAMMENFMSSEESSKGIADRLRITYGAAYSGFMTLCDHFVNHPKAVAGIRQLARDDQWIFNAYVRGKLPGGNIDNIDKDLLRVLKLGKPLMEFTIDYARKAAAEVVSINFTVRFWSNVMDLWQRNRELSKFIWFERCKINPETNRVDRLATSVDGEGIVRCVLINWEPLYSEVEKDLRQRGLEQDLGLAGLKRQTSTERYYVPSPSDSKNRSHRFVFEKGKGQVSVGVLRCDRMDRALELVFIDRFEEEDEAERLAI